MLPRRVVIKVGSNVLTHNSGELDVDRLAKICTQIQLLRQENVEVVLVSSGAVASGRGIVKLSDKTDAIAAKQVLAAVGQVRLLNHYYEQFEKLHLTCAQVLVTKEDFRDRTHYSNMRNCLSALLANKIIPVVNENDVIAITELMFTDNDELAALLAGMLNADILLILSNVDGIYAKTDATTQPLVIHTITQKTDFLKYITASKSGFGRGGMITKSNTAYKLAQTGIKVKIVNGKKDDIIWHALHDYDYKVGTTFLPSKSATAAKKKLAFSENFSKGEVIINEGAEQALAQSNQANSLLMVGVTQVLGDFQVGDIIRIKNQSHNTIAVGKAQYTAKKAAELIGKKGIKPLVHYDYLYLME